MHAGTLSLSLSLPPSSLPNHFLGKCLAGRQALCDTLFIQYVTCWLPWFCCLPLHQTSQEGEDMRTHPPPTLPISILTTITHLTSHLHTISLAPPLPLTHTLSTHHESHFPTSLTHQTHTHTHTHLTLPSLSPCLFTHTHTHSHYMMYHSNSVVCNRF